MRRTILIILAIGLTSCGLFRSVVVVPDSREIKEVPGEPGWYKISGGHLKELYDQQRILVEELEECKRNQ